MRPLARVRSVDGLFRALMPALGPYRDQVVVTGGTARDLYAFLPGYRDLGLAGAQTLDIDIAVADPLQIIAGRKLHDLLIEQGMAYVPNSAHRERPPFGMILVDVACRYYPAGIRNPTARHPHIDFITQLEDPKSNSNAHPQRDALIAYTLDYVALLLASPVTVKVPRVGSVRLPHPLAYAIQKLLIRSERMAQRKNFAKDTADGFAVVMTLRAVWPSWQKTFQEWKSHRRYGRWIDEVEAAWSRLFSRSTDDGVREVCATYRTLTPEAVVQVMTDLRSDLNCPPPSRFQTPSHIIAKRRKT